MKRLASLLIVFGLAAALVAPAGVAFATIYTAGSLLQVGDVKTEHILDGTILDRDISASAEISATKIVAAAGGGYVPYADYGKLSTSTKFYYSTTTSTLTNTGSTTLGATTTINNVQYVWPSSQGAANTILQDDGSGTLSWHTGGGSDVQVFTTSGTWTKPTGVASTTRILVQVWGGGGSGANMNGNAAGGGGGGYAERWYTASQLASTESVTVGTGAPSPSGNTYGLTGNESSFSTGTTTVTAYGGSGGNGNSANSATTGGTGGGSFGNGSPSAPITQAGVSGATPNPAIEGAGGGGTNASNQGQAGGAAEKGGGGGGGCGSSTNGSGGVSLLGGAGGAGNKSGAGTAGTQPGGGGGGSCNNGGAGAGADGEVIVTTFP